MEIDISVVIPVYNTEKYLKKCLDSILSQTYQNFEILLVDDGSIDKSSEIIHDYMKKYPGIIHGFFQENRGQSSARNLALRHAKGEYISFIDSDDYIGPLFFEQLYKTAKKYMSDMVICNYTKVSENGEIIKRFNANFVEDRMRIPSYISCNHLVKRELIEKYNLYYSEGVICEDIPFILKLEAVAKNTKIIPMEDYFYRTNPKSTTSSYGKRKFRMEQLPIDAMKEAVLFCQKYNENISGEWLEFLVCRIWTSLIFEIGKDYTPDVQKGICKAVTKFMNDFYPECTKNQYVKLNRFKTLPMIQKLGTLIFVQSYRMRLLYPAMKLSSLL